MRAKVRHNNQNFYPFLNSFPTKNYDFLKVDRQGFVMVPKSGKKVMITMGKSHLKTWLTFARTPIPREKKLCAIIYQLITQTILMLLRKGNMILKVDSQGFVMVRKNVKKLWLSRSYLELKKA